MTLSRRWRKVTLATHLSVAIGWLGAVAAYVVLDVTVAMSRDPSLVRAAWISMGLVITWAIVPLALASLLTGIVLSLGTKWGLFRHWWVLISLLLTLLANVVLLSEVGVVIRAAHIATDPSGSDALLLTLPSTLPHSVGGLLVLLVVQVLNVFKPQGLTPYGWRKHDESLEARQDGQPAGLTTGAAGEDT